MKRLDNPADVERFRALILARLGLQFEDSKLGFLAEVIQLRLDETRLTTDDYLRLLEFDPAAAELPLLAKELTVPETYFFRNHDQLRAFAEVAVPARLRRSATGRLNVLSAGCASGEEPYSIAMLLLAAGMEPGREFSVRAIDINPAVLKKARRGRYSPWAFRETPDEHRQRWFKADGRDFLLDEQVRRAVQFLECNLVGDGSDIWRPHGYDVIFCRNVLMYFSAEQARRVIARMATALAPGGFLFLGHAETLRGLSEDFHLRHTHGAFYYELKDAGEVANLAPDFSWSPTMPAVPSAAASPPPPLSDDWIQSIRRASERVHALSTEGRRDAAAGRNPPPAAMPAAGRPSVAPATDMAPVFALLHGDRFGDALTYVRELPQAAAADPDVLLVEAMLLAHAGTTSEAEEVCQRLLQIDEMNASAHHVLALCREAAGDLDGAMEQDRIAAYLDPTFAMPHLHLGLLGRRTGNRDLARRELGQALPLLRHEDGARLLLFGGGFNRQSMIDLCASALRDVGGSA